MTRKTKMFFAKLLIVLSVILIIWGTILQVNSDDILHPVDDVTVLAGVDKEIISITTVDSDEEIEPIVGDDSSVLTTPVVIPPIDSGKGESSNTGGNSSSKPTTGSNSGSSNSSSSGSTNNSNNNGNNNGSQTPAVPTVAELNVRLRTQIESTYGVKVKFGSETAGYSVGGMSTTAIPDDATCRAALTNLNKALSLYPTNFFKEINNKGYPLTFYLIKRYSRADVTGVTDSSYKNIIISIATDFDFADTLHHEVYHYIERYIFSTGFRFTSWSTLNPSGFVYGTVNSNYSYAKTFSPDAYFVNSYAQSDEYEDRASTFEYMMKSSKASCLNSGKVVWLKAKTMSEQIDYFLNTVSPNVTEYWERYVY